MRIVRTIAELRGLRPSLGRLGLVPTMGALHDGHMSLVARATARCDAVAASIFVNPAQFAPNEDFAQYPRPVDADLAKLEAAGVAVAFLPDPDEIYPPGFDTRIEVGAIADRLEGAVRPGHFAGVATVVAKLFIIASPDIAFFGQKDVQQTRVIRQLVRDLNLAVEIEVAPTIRETDGLALSSRNVYLSPAHRAEAAALFRGLTAAATAFATGERDVANIKQQVEAPIRVTSGLIDYVSVADPDTMTELERIDPRGAIVSLAVRFGTTRLLDNIMLPASGH